MISLVPDAPWAASVFGYARPGETQSTAIAHYWCPSERALIRRLDEECSDSSYHVALATSRERGQRATLHRSADGWYVASRRPWTPQIDAGMMTLSDALEEIERLRADLDTAAGMISIVLSSNMLNSNAYETQRGDSAPVINALRDIVNDWEGDER